MKKILVAIALLVGTVGVSHASRSGGGWRPYTLSASSAQVFTGYGYLNAISQSSACTQGDYMVAFDTVAISTVTGLGIANSAQELVFSNAFSTTTTLTPPLVFGSTISQAGLVATPANPYWTPGQASGDYLEVFNGLFVWKNTGASGNCDKAVIYWAK